MSKEPDDDPLMSTVTPEDLPDATESMNLAVKAQGGDTEALESLLSRYEDRLRRIISIRLSSKLRRVVESMDIVQETYKSAFDKIDRLELRSPASILQWLSKIAENQMIDTHRFFYGQKRDRDREINYDDPNIRRGVEATKKVSVRRPDEVAAQNELERIVDECVGQLPHDYREVIMLRTYYGGSWDWVTKQMGRPNVEATRQLHRRARIRLGRIVRARLGEGSSGDKD